MTVLHRQHERVRVRRGVCAARAVVALGALTLLVAVGCHFPRPQPRKPNLYEVRGRVIDADTNQGVAGARVRLRATIAGAVGAQYLTSYAVSRADGTYGAELSATFDVMQDAAEIRLDASKEGYIPGGADLAPPARKRDYYEAPDIVVKRGETPPRPADLEGLGVPLSRPAPDDLPWKRRRIRISEFGFRIGGDG